MATFRPGAQVNAVHGSPAAPSWSPVDDAADDPITQLRLSEERLRLAQEVAQIGTFEWRIATGAVIWSSELEALHGLAPRTFGATVDAWLSLVHPEDRTAVAHKLREALVTGKLEAEWRVMRPDGEVRSLGARAQVFVAADGAPDRLIGVNIDVTARRQAEDARHRTEALYRALASQLPNGAAFVVDRDLRYLVAEGQVLRARGLTPADYEGRTLREASTTADADQKEADYRGALAGQPFKREHEENGRFFITHGVPLRDAQGEIYAVLAFSYDITDQRRTFNALRRTESLLTAVLEALPAGVAMADADGALFRVNKVFREQWGVAPATTSWQQYGEWEGYRVDSGARLEAREWAMARALLDGEVITGDLVEIQPFHGGERRFLLNNAAPMHDNRGELIGAVVATFDVSEGVELDRALRARERELQMLTDHVPDVIARFDRQLRHTFVNRAVETFTGLPMEQFVGRTHREMGWPEHLCELWEQTIEKVFESGRPSEIEYELPTPNGLAYFASRYVPEFSPEGSVEYVISLHHDFTERRTAELAQRAALDAERRLAEQVRRAHDELESTVAARTHELRTANEELRSFAHSVAHDLRAPLRHMHGYAAALLETEAERLSPQSQAFARKLIDSAGRMDTLLQDLLAYSRVTHRELVLSSVPLEPVILQVVAGLRDEIDATQAQIEIKTPLPEVTANEGLLQQVLDALLSNAIKFVSPGVQPRIHIAAEQIGEFVRCTVQDNGIGIAPEYQTRIFGVFERLHHERDYSGNGIGLAIASRALERMNGRLEVESTAGEGSRFTLELRAGAST